MNLAYTMAPGRGDTDLILFTLAERLAARGLRARGLVQVNSVQINFDRADAGPCDMNVRVLPDGPVLRISQDLGPEARGCRLNPAALETAVGLVAASLRHGADVLVINKFGKHEAEGRGFRPVIADALLDGIPVLVGLNTLNLPSFRQFSDGLGTGLPCNATALEEWVTASLPGATQP